MKVILREEVDNLGNAGDLVQVRAGYARNFLFPRSLAVRADENNLAQLEHQKRVMEARRKRLEVAAKGLAGAIEKVGRIVIVRACGADKKLFGSVTAQDVANAVVLGGAAVEKKAIELSEPIKGLGDFEVSVKAGQGIKVIVKVSVEPDPASADLIARSEAAAAAAAAEAAKAPPRESRRY